MNRQLATFAFAVLLIALCATRLPGPRPERYPVEVEPIRYAPDLEPGAGMC
jgi:hypothetical protein